MRVLLRRSLVRADQLIAALLLVAVGTGAIAALVASLAAGVDSGVSAVLRATEPTTGALRIDTALDPDVAAQDERFRAGIAEAVGDAPVHVVGGIRSDPLTATVAGHETPVQLGSQEDLERLAELVAGVWPTADDEASLSEAAAAALGVAVGDTVTAAGRDYRIAAIWRATRRRIPRVVLGDRHRVRAARRCGGAADDRLADARLAHAARGRHLDDRAG